MLSPLSSEENDSLQLPDTFPAGWGGGYKYTKMHLPLFPSLKHILVL